MTAAYAQLWLTAFVWTCAIELPIYVGFLRRYFGRWWAPVLVAMGLNITTHPVLWFVVPQFQPYWKWVVCAELGVWVTETLLCTAVLSRMTSWRSALLQGALTAFVANLVSTLVGFYVI